MKNTDSIFVWQNKNKTINSHIATTLEYGLATKTTSEHEYSRCLANARLIAAAPEMLEALVKIVNCFETAEDSLMLSIIKDKLPLLIKKAT